MSRVFLLFVLFSVPASALSADADETPKDYTNASLESLGVTPVKPHKDVKSDFVIGGKNATVLIRKVTSLAGQPIAKLEKRMRPGADSRAGFLGKDESLLDVLAADNRFVVEELGLTHQELARHLHLIGAIAAKQGKGKSLDIRYHDQVLRLETSFSRGIQESPFDDETKTNCNTTIQNTASGKKLTYSLLVPHMMERYGFYEGKGTPYRVDPRAVLEVLPFIRPTPKR
jgi:hypothetical protein